MLIPVSMMMDDSGKWNRLMRRYLMHLASLMQPLSSCREYRYEMPQITAFFRPCGDGGGPGGALRGSATGVTDWQTTHLIDLAPGGSCKGVRQPEQLTSIICIFMSGFGEGGIVKKEGVEL